MGSLLWFDRAMLGAVLPGIFQGTRTGGSMSGPGEVQSAEKEEAHVGRLRGREASKPLLRPLP